MGEVTDVKIVRTADGTSRQMAFVGFKTEEMATEALKYFNGTFIDTSRVEVQYARSVHSAQIPRPWSKYSAGSSANKEKERKKKILLVRLPVQEIAESYMPVFIMIKTQ